MSRSKRRPSPDSVLAEIIEGYAVSADCPECGHGIPMEFSRCLNCDPEATSCLGCGFVSNVPALIAAHDFGHTEDT